jgi:hypothetical protein
MIPIKKLGRLVRTKLSTWLTPELADKAIEILNQSRR